jgi:hypothetical protein
VRWIDVAWVECLLMRSRTEPAQVGKGHTALSTRLSSHKCLKKLMDTAVAVSFIRLRLRNIRTSRSEISLSDLVNITWLRG